MAKAKRDDNEGANSEAQEIVVNLQRIANLLALNLIKGEEDEAEKIKTLAAVGYGSSEIARLLGRSPGSVRMALLRARNESQNE